MYAPLLHTHRVRNRDKVLGERERKGEKVTERHKESSKGQYPT